MENWVLLIMSFGAMILGIVSAYLFGDTRASYTKERELIDTLSRPDRSPWDIINERCAYCNGKLSLVTDRCTHCGAPK